MGDGPGRLTDVEVEERLDALDGVLAAIEQMAGAEGDTARVAVSLLAEIYGEALARLLGLAAAPPDVARRVCRDELLGHLLALHGLHPDPPERRIEELVAEMQTHLRGSATVEFAGSDDGVARLRVSADGPGADRLSASVRDLVLGAAPDLVGVEATAAPAPTSTFIPIESVRRRTS